MTDGDWFHAILEYLNRQPINGEWHDLRNIYGQGKPIYFDHTEGRNGYKRIDDVLHFLADRQFIKFRYDVADGVVLPRYTIFTGKVLDLGQAPTYLDVDNGRTLDLEGTEKTLHWMAQLLPEGHTYWTQRQRTIELHKSTMTTNLFIILTFCAMLLTAGLQIWQTLQSKADAKAAREQIDRIQVEAQESNTRQGKLQTDSSKQKDGCVRK